LSVFSKGDSGIASFSFVPKVKVRGGNSGQTFKNSETGSQKQVPRLSLNLKAFLAKTISHFFLLVNGERLYGKQGKHR
jgi:hypothetical protein